MMRKKSSAENSQGGSPTKAGQGITLTQEFLVMKTRQPLHLIQKLNLWGNDLQDVAILKNLPNLEVLALTVNQITTMKDLAGLYSLRELYLRRNYIPASLQEMRCLTGLKNLKVLNLGENPISSEQGGIPFYRSVVLKHMPWLEKLDDVPVTYDEVQMAQEIDLDQIQELMTQPPQANDAQKKAYVHTTFIPNESQQFVPQKKMNFAAQQNNDQSKNKSPGPLRRGSQHESVVTGGGGFTGQSQREASGQRKINFAPQVVLHQPRDAFKPGGRQLQRTPPNEERDRSQKEDGEPLRRFPTDIKQRGDNIEFQDPNDEMGTNRTNQGPQRAKTSYERQWPGNAKVLQQRAESPAHPNFQQVAADARMNTEARASPTRVSPTKADRRQVQSQQNNEIAHKYIPAVSKKPTHVSGGNSGRHTDRAKNQAMADRHMNQKILKKNIEKKRKKNKNENILCAIIALMKELDKSGLEFIKLDAMKRITKLEQKQQQKNGLHKNSVTVKPGSHISSSTRGQSGLHSRQKNPYYEEETNLDGETAIDDERYDDNINERSADNSDQQNFDEDEDLEQDSEDEDANMDYDMDEAAPNHQIGKHDRIRYNR